jgi:hypothetical protein
MVKREITQQIMGSLQVKGLSKKMFTDPQQAFVNMDGAFGKGRTA